MPARITIALFQLSGRWATATITQAAKPTMSAAARISIAST